MAGEVVEIVKGALKSSDAAAREAILDRLRVAASGEPQPFAGLVGLYLWEDIVHATSDPSASVRVKALGALATLCPQHAEDPLVGALKDPDAQVRRVAVQILGERGRESIARGTSFAEDANPLIEALTDHDPSVRELAVSAVALFGRKYPTRVIRALIVTMQDKEPSVRAASVRALRETDQDEASQALPDLIALIKDPEPGVRHEALATLRWPGSEATRKASAIIEVMIHDCDESVRDDAARTLLEVAPRDKIVAELNEVRVPASRAEILRILRQIGPGARVIRQEVEIAWDGDQIPDSQLEGTIPESDAPRESGRASRPRFEQWAVGLEDNKKWHVFHRMSGKWRACGPLTGLQGGLRAKLLKAFAEQGGALRKAEAIAVAGHTYSPLDDDKVMKAVSPELSHLRRILRQACKITNSNADPLPWDGARRSWVAAIHIGYAVQEDGQRVGGERRLTFKTHQNLSAEEKMDADV
jgi:HEAT repeat protein